MSRLDEAWTAWRKLSRIERSQFLARFREAYRADRELMRRGRSYPTTSSFADIRLTDADFEGRPEAVRSSGAEFALPEMTWE